MSSGPYRENQFNPDQYFSPKIIMDIKRAAYAWAILNNIGPTALLGGAILSWASGIEARDWDFYMSTAQQKALEVEGWRFTNKAEKTYGDDYSARVELSGWRVADNKLMGKEQVILISPTKGGVSHPDMAWQTFDYGHCMIGLTHDLQPVDVGDEVICDGKLVANPNMMVIRSHRKVLKKLKNKMMFGLTAADNPEGPKTPEAARITVKQKLRAAREAFAYEAKALIGNTHLPKGYEDLRKALKL